MTFFNIDEWPVNVKLHLFELNKLELNWTVSPQGIYTQRSSAQVLTFTDLPASWTTFLSFSFYIIIFKFRHNYIYNSWNTVYKIKQFINIINKIHNANILHSSQDRSCTANHDICLHRHIHCTIISQMYSSFRPSYRPATRLFLFSFSSIFINVWIGCTNTSLNCYEKITSILRKM